MDMEKVLQLRRYINEGFTLNKALESIVKTGNCFVSVDMYEKVKEVLDQIGVECCVFYEGNGVYSLKIVGTV